MKERQKQMEADKAHLAALRREFHRYPELGMQEFRTAQRIEEELDKLGIPRTRIGKTGVLGTIRGKGTGNRVVVLRADIDALPIFETTGAEYCSEVPGVMHACGHDAHITCLLGAAKLLAEQRESFGGEARLVFQPGEEIGKGAEDFVKAGVLENADRVFGLHVASELPIGTVGLKPGLNNAAVDQFKITVRGKSAHVSTPQLGVDALYIASQIVVAFQALVTRRTAAVEPVIIGVGKLNAGTTYNAVAETAVLEGTTRTISAKMRGQVRALMEKTVQNTADIYGGKAEIEWVDVASALINDPEVCLEAEKAAEKLFEKYGIVNGRVMRDRPLSLSGDNFSEFLLRTKGAYAYLGSGNPALPNTQSPGHNGNFDIDEDALVLGAGLYAEYAVSQLQGVS